MPSIRAHPGLIIGIILVLLFCAAIVLFVRREPVLKDAVSQIWTRVIEVGRTVRIYSYMFRWVFIIRTRTLIIHSVIGVLLSTAFFVVIEMVLAALHDADALLPLLHLRELPQLPRFPRVVEYVLLGLGLLMAGHRWHEWKLRKREAEVPRAVCALLRQLEALSAGNVTQPDREAFLELFMAEFRKVLETGRRMKIAVALLEQNAQAELAMTFKHPANAPFDTSVTFCEGEGGAGAALKVKGMVYIPSVKHRLGVIIGAEYKPLGPTYKADARDAFRSILSVPVMRNAAVAGILTFSTLKRGTFLPLDFDIANMAAALLALLD